MRKYPRNRYVSGTYKRVDDISGFDYVRSELVKDYRGLLVHPDNLDRKPVDEMRVPLPIERRLKFE